MTQPTGTLIGFDFGERRIGVAVGETGTGIANPLGAIDAAANDARFREIGKLVDEWRPAGFVVGRPRHQDDSEHALMTISDMSEVEAVMMVDETLTSATAEASLRGTRAGTKRKGDVDAVAAAIILQSYLDDPDAGEHAPA